MRNRWLLPLALATACAPVSSPDGDPDLATIPIIDQPFDLRVGERAFVEDASSYVRFREVSGDSRCPSEALILCVWEGDAVVLLELDPEGGPQRLSGLHTTLDPKALDLGPVVLHLEELAPYPRTTAPIPPEEYVATFVLRSTS